MGILQTPINSTIQDILTMNMKLSLVFCLVLVAIAAAQPPKPKAELGCSPDQLIKCVGEIEAAWGDCFNAGDIFQCITNVLGASDCIACVCDVLAFLGLYNC